MLFNCRSCFLAKVSGRSTKQQNMWPHSTGGHNVISCSNFPFFHILYGSSLAVKPNHWIFIKIWSLQPEQAWRGMNLSLDQVLQQWTQSALFHPGGVSLVASGSFQWILGTNILSHLSRKSIYSNDGIIIWKCLTHVKSLELSFLGDSMLLQHSLTDFTMVG